MSLHPLRERLRSIDPVLRTGRVRKVMATHIESSGPNVVLGTVCDIEGDPRAGRSYAAEVVRVDSERVILSPFEDGIPTLAGAMVRASPLGHAVPVGTPFLARAVDALGRPQDGKGPVRAEATGTLRGRTPSALDRQSPLELLETGVRAIDGLLTLGRGQRVGIFAASGVGKTTLLAQFARHVRADVVILCLVGERGREVEAIWNEELDEEARARTTLVAATSDQSAAMRVRAVHYALALAEHWRDLGKHVLLVLDSVTRLAMAMREIGLAAGEPPTIRAYTPSVFAQLPKIVERCGAIATGGAISAVMAVLSETDEIDDPVSELMKSLLDGHIILSRSLAERGQFPAIDVCRSVSRQSDRLMEERQRDDAVRVLAWQSMLEGSRTLIDTGLYSKGANPRLDAAITRQAEIFSFLAQERNERAKIETTRALLSRLSREER